MFASVVRCGRRGTGGEVEFAPPEWMPVASHTDPNRAAYIPAARMELRCWQDAGAILAAEGLVVEVVSRQLLARAVDAAFQRASLELAVMKPGVFPLWRGSDRAET